MNIVTLSDKNMMLVIGGYDMKIHVYLIPRMQIQESRPIFNYKFSLPGHLNSLKDFDFTDELLGNKVRYLASGSQDNYIRIWKIQPLENLSEEHGGHEGDL